MRASPFGDIDCHCHPTVRRTGSLTEGVEQVRTTSLPIRSAAPSVPVGVCMHIHSRPFASVTVRFAIVVLLVLYGCMDAHARVVHSGLSGSGPNTSGRRRTAARIVPTW